MALVGNIQICQTHRRPINQFRIRLRSPLFGCVPSPLHLKHCNAWSETRTRVQRHCTASSAYRCRRRRRRRRRAGWTLESRACEFNPNRFFPASARSRARERTRVFVYLLCALTQAHAPSWTRARARTLICCLGAWCVFIVSPPSPSPFNNNGYIFTQLSTYAN